MIQSLSKNHPLVIFGVAIFMLLLGISWGLYHIQSAAIPNDAKYIGSSACEACHLDEMTGWYHSLHPKMMRRIDAPGAIVADLQSDDLAFDPQDAIWVIGSKWEQQFMGVKDGHETLLPGAWNVGKKTWKNTGWDGWKVPDPLKRCHGCHTVGLDVETGKFAEPSVGCESCHGPGSWHENTAGLGKIYSAIDPQVCGQCHTRGRSTDGQYFFPVGYRPGNDLFEYFREDEPDYIQNSSKWWGNGHPRKRHQEYYAWRQGGHANSLISLTRDYDGKYGEVTGECLSCHAGEAIMDGQSKDYKLDEVQYGVTCAVCHFSHGDLDKERIACADCHGTGASYHSPSLNSHHVPCPEQANVQCIQCHMPLTIVNGGDYTLHSHMAGIIPPADTTTFGVPNSCANGGCHGDRDVQWLQAEFEKHYAEKP